MKSYKELYFHLFNTLTDAIEELQEGRVILALHRMMEAQQQAEERVMEADILPNIPSAEIQEFSSKR